MEITIRKLYNSNGKETGAVLRADTDNDSPLDSYRNETRLVEYAFTELYPNEVLSLFSEINVGVPSIMVVRNVKDLPQTILELDGY